MVKGFVTSRYWRSWWPFKKTFRQSQTLSQPSITVDQPLFYALLLLVLINLFFLFLSGSFALLANVERSYWDVLLDRFPLFLFSFTSQAFKTGKNKHFRKNSGLTKNKVWQLAYIVYMRMILDMCILTHTVFFFYYFLKFSKYF